MRLDALDKAITFFDMDDIFNIITCETVKMLEMKLEDLFDAQALVKTAVDSLVTNPTDSTLKLAVADSMAKQQSAEEVLERVAIEPVYLLKNYKDIDKETVRVSNRYYSRFGEEYLVENLLWSSDRILQTCEEPLRNKILEGIVGISPMDSVLRDVVSISYFKLT